MGGGIAGDAHEDGARRRRDQGFGTGQAVAGRVFESLFEVLAAGFAAGHQWQPLVADLKHALDQIADGSDVVVEVQEDGFERPAEFALFLDRGDGAARGFFEERARVFGDGGGRAEAGQPGHLPGNGGAQRIDGLDAQPRGVLENLPAQAAILRERSESQFVGDALMRLLRKLAGGRSLPT